MRSEFNNNPPCSENMPIVLEMTRWRNWKYINPYVLRIGYGSHDNTSGGRVIYGLRFARICRSVRSVANRQNIFEPYVPEHNA